MAEVQVEMVGDSPNDMEERFKTLSSSNPNTDEALLEVAYEVKDDLEKTSPVDTGEYQGSWYIEEVAEDEVWILNEADHAQYVMLANSKMQGSSKADLPSVGILHNVEGVARRHSGDLRSGVLNGLLSFLGGIK